MLEIKNIKKVYKTGSFTQTALKNVSIKFRKNEFVTILTNNKNRTIQFIKICLF